MARCAKSCFEGAEEDRAEQLDQGLLTMLWEIKTWYKERVSWKKLTEMLTCWSRYFFVVIQNPGKNAQHLGFVFFAELALQSDDCIETCDFCSEKHLWRCHVQARAPKEYISAAETFLSKGCDNTKPRPQTCKGTINHEVGLDG